MRDGNAPSPAARQREEVGVPIGLDTATAGVSPGQADLRPAHRRAVSFSTEGSMFDVVLFTALGSFCVVWIVGFAVVSWELLREPKAPDDWEGK